MPPTSEKTPEDDGSKNMVSNLPLVFADGYPTSLDKITEAQLEKFIPFMVQCSLGNVTIEKMTEFNKPAWWPKDLEFTKPFKRPKSFVGDWLLKMRELVVACYNSHDNIYLLRYCADLAKFQPTALRFINNYNSTTSLYERSSNKLLVTFRNENMMYDQQRKMNSRKCLLPKQSNSQTCLAAQEEMVISECFDIYLCDNCDAELYSAGAMKDHERYCNAQQSNAEQEETSDDDDVIFCGTVPDDQLPLDSAARAQSKQQKMVSFLAQNFMLRCANTKEAVTHQTTPSKSSGSNSNETDGGAVESGKAGKQHRVPRRSRQVVTLAKSTTIPLSSPLGLFLLKTSKIIITPEYLSERFDRMERFCAAPALPFGTSYPLRPSLSGGGLQEPLTAHDRRLPKWLFGKVKTSNGSNGCPVTFKRVSDDSVEPSQHQYKFPRRQLSTKHRVENFLFYNKLLLQRCRSCVVGIERLTIADVQELALLPGIEREQREADEAARLERQRRKEIAELAESAMVIDSIDLCSSDEDIGPEFSTVENAQHTHECSSYNNYIAHDAIETIIIEKDDSSDTNEFTNTNPFYVDVAPEQSFNTGSSVLAEMVPKIAKKSFIGAMLSESTYRLNQSLPAGHGRAMEGARQPLTEPLYLYAHCSQAVVNGSEEAQFSSGNRLIARKSTSLPLKENLVHGFGSTGTNSANGESLLAGTGSQCAATPVPMHQAAVQSRTVLLTGAVTNGHAIIGTIPVSFGSGSNLHSRANASVVQTLSTATYASQTIHSHASINHSNGPSAAAIPSPPTVANLQ